MKIFNKSKDGGKESNVDAYFLFEIKGFISVALLKFNEGTRENFHSHAFDAFTWFICGEMEEERVVDNSIIVKKYKRSILPKFTSKDNLHRVKAIKPSWCFTLRGKWDDTWYEYNESQNKKIVLTHGRKVVKEVINEI